MEFTDTHCHIHSADYPLANALSNAAEAGVSCLLCVGTDLADSQLAIEFAKNQPNCWASIGIHPHEAKDYVADATKLPKFADLAKLPKVVAIGECGLDYHYNYSAKTDQEKVLRFQLDLAKKHNLPLIFHVREAFDDFWRIFDDYQGLRGVIHSFSSDTADLDQILSRGLYVGLNGIMTFTKDQNQLLAAKTVPLNRLLLETDAPFLTPAPYRGTICEPKHLCATAEFLAGLRGETVADLATATTTNAKSLFYI